MRKGLMLLPKIDSVRVIVKLLARAVLSAVLFLGSAREVTGQTYAPGAVVDASLLLGNELDPAVAVNPTNASALFVVSAAGTGLFTGTSTNQGSKWTTAEIATGKDALVPAYGLPSTAWDSYGNVYVAYWPSTFEGVAVAISTNAGKNFTQLTNLAAADATLTPSIATGPSGSNGTGTAVWVVYKDTSQVGTPVMAQGLLVTNLGATAIFGPPQAIPNSAGGGFPAVAVGPQGQVLVAFQNNLTSDNKSQIFTSVNTNAFGTNGFSAPVVAANDAAGGKTYLPAQPTGNGVSATPGLAFDPAPFSAFYGRAYLVYAGVSSIGNLIVASRYSTDNGANWSAETNANDDITANSHFFPRVAVDPETGIVAYSWYDCRNDLGAGSQTVIQTTFTNFVFNSLTATNLTVLSNNLMNPTLTITTNALGSPGFTITISANNLLGSLVSTDGVQDIFIGTTNSKFLTLELTGLTGTNSTGNQSVSLELVDQFTDAFTDGTANQEAMLYTTVSTNGSAGFAVNQPVTPLIDPINPNSPIDPPVLGYASKGIGANSPLGFGSYTGLAFFNGTFYPVWADNSDLALLNPNGVLSNFDICTAPVVVPIADLSVSVTYSPNPVLSDGVVAYTVTIKNNGPSPEACVVTDTLPANVIFEYAVPAVGASYSVNGQDVILTFPTPLPPKSTETNLILVTASSSGYGTNVATISGPLPDQVPTNNISTVVALFAGEDLGLGMTSSSSNVFGGETVTNVIALTNFGPSANGEVIVSNLFSANWGQIEVLSGGWIQLGAATSPGTYSINNNLLVLNLGQLSSNNSTNIVVSALALATAPVGFDFATVSSLDYDPNPSNNSASITTFMTPEALGVTFSASPANAVSGTVMTFAIGVTNFGPSPDGYVMATETLPASFNSISNIQSPYPATVNGNTITFPIGVLANNTGVTLSFTAFAQDAGTFMNTVVASSTNYAPAVTNDSAITVLVPPPPIENLTVVPGADGAFVVWDTPVNATAQVSYGLTPSYGLVSSITGLSTHHIILLSGLQRDAYYYFSAGTPGTTNMLSGSFGTTNTYVLGTQDAAYSGEWTANSTGTGIFGAYYSSANSTVGNTASSSAKYSPDIEVEGLYNVSNWYPISSIFATNTPIYVSGGTNEIITNVNQATNGGGWQPLAHDLYFATGTAGNVEIFNNTGNTTRGVIANGVMWAYDPAQDVPSNGVPPAWWSHFYGVGSGTGSSYAAYVFGTALTNVNFIVTAPVSNTFTVSFTPFQPGRSYQLLASPDLTTWTTLTNVATQNANTGYGVFTISPPPATAAFYLLSASIAP
jgi:uncharacterized repeat protein (TIGR01451 family)